MKFLVTGYYGMANFGDDLMLDVVLRGIAARLPGAEIDVLTVGTIPAEPLPCGGKFIRAVRRSELVRLYLAGYDAVLFGGGTGLNSRGGTAGSYLNWLARLAGSPLYWIGFGVDDDDNRWHNLRAAFSLRACSHVWLRDEGSVRAMRKRFPWYRKFTPTADLVWLADIGVVPVEKENLLTVAWGDDITMIDRSLCRDDVAGVARCAVDFARRHDIAAICIAEMCSGHDARAAEDLEKLFASIAPERSVIRAKGTDFASKMNLVRKSRMLVSARLHPFMAAKIAGVPAVGYNYADKVDSFSRLLVSPSVMTPGDPLKNPGKVLDLWEREFASPAGVVDIAHHRALAEHNFDFL